MEQFTPFPLVFCCLLACATGITHALSLLVCCHRQLMGIKAVIGHSTGIPKPSQPLSHSTSSMFLIILTSRDFVANQRQPALCSNQGLTVPYQGFCRQPPSHEAAFLSQPRLPNQETVYHFSRGCFSNRLFGSPPSSNFILSNSEVTVWSC